jgi:hypothetical protein
MIPRNKPKRPAPPDPTFALPPEAITVRDLTIAFVGGFQLPLTLGPNDTRAENDKEIVVTLSSGEVFTIARSQIAWMSERARQITKPPAPYAPRSD